MSRIMAGETVGAEDAMPKTESFVSESNSKSSLTEVAAWVSDHNLPLLAMSIGMSVMLLWAGAYKMTAPGAEGIVPLVSNSPLTSWLFKLFGPYISSDFIGLTEITAAVLIITGYLKAKAGILGGLITSVMFFTTSTMLITTPGSTAIVHGARYMTFVGLFLYKDVISFGVSLFLISYFGKKAADAGKTKLKQNRGAQHA